MTGRFSNLQVAGWPTFVAFCAFAGSFLVCASTGVRINTTESLPRGLYVTTARDTALVEFCPEEPFASMALQRGYRSQGSCRDGGMPLLKPVVAVPGDLVAFSDRGIGVNGRLLENTAPLSADSFGRALPVWPFGTYRVAPDEVWVASSYTPRSFDSRYFGPIPRTAIRERIRPLITESK